MEMSSFSRHCAHDEQDQLRA